MAAFPPNMLTGKEYYEDRAELNERAAGMFKKAKAMTPTAQEIATSAAWRLLSHLDQAATPSVTDVEIVARFVTKLRSLPTAPAQTGAATPAPTLQENTAHHASVSNRGSDVAVNAGDGTGVGSASLSPVAPAPTAGPEDCDPYSDGAHPCNAGSTVKPRVKSPAPTAGEVTEKEIKRVLLGSPTLDASRVMSLLREKGMVKP